MNKVCNWFILWSLFWSKLFQVKKSTYYRCLWTPVSSLIWGQLLCLGWPIRRPSLSHPSTHPGLMLMWLPTGHRHLWTSVACRACVGGRGFFSAKLTGRPAWLREGFSEAAGMTSDSHSGQLLRVQESRLPWARWSSWVVSAGCVWTCPVHGPHWSPMWTSQGHSLSSKLDISLSQGSCSRRPQPGDHLGPLLCKEKGQTKQAPSPRSAHYLMSEAVRVPRWLLSTFPPPFCRWA